MLIKYLIDNELNDSILYTCGITGMIAIQDLLQNDISISVMLNNLLRICANIIAFKAHDLTCYSTNL